MKFCLNWFAPESNKKDWYRKVMMLCSFVIRNPCWRRSKDLVQIGCGSSECRFGFFQQKLPSCMQTSASFQELIVLWQSEEAMIQSLDQQFNSEGMMAVGKDLFVHFMTLFFTWLYFPPVHKLMWQIPKKWMENILERILDSTKKCRTCSESWNVQSLTCRPRAQFLKLTRFYFSRRCLRDGVRASSVIWENVSNGMKSYGIFVSFCYSSEIKRWGCNGIESVTGIWRVTSGLLLHWWQNGHA